MQEDKHSSSNRGGTHVRIHGNGVFLGTVNFDHDPDGIVENIAKLSRRRSDVVVKNFVHESVAGSLSDSMCCACSHCSAVPTHHTKIEIGGMSLYIGLCEEHAMVYEASRNPRGDYSTVVIYADRDTWVPRATATDEHVKRMYQIWDMIDFNHGKNIFATGYNDDGHETVRFWCQACGKVHRHGAVSGSRVPHCDVYNGQYTIITPNDLRVIRECFDKHDFHIDYETTYRQPTVYHDDELIKVINQHVNKHVVNGKYASDGIE